MELDAVADLEGVGLAVVGRLRHLGAQIADEIGRRGRVLRVDPDQHAVERRGRVHRRVGRLAMPVEARRRVGRDHVGQRAAAFRRFAATPALRRSSGDAPSRARPPQLASLFPPARNRRNVLRRRAPRNDDPVAVLRPERAISLRVPGGALLVEPDRRRGPGSRSGSGRSSSP